MKTIIKKNLSHILILFVLVSQTNLSATNDKGKKKVQNFKVERTIHASAEAVWKVVGEDFGAIANSHPLIVSSEYNQGSISQGGEGAERICNLNENGTKFIKEKQLNFNPENYSFTVQVFQTAGLPLNPDYTKAIYTVVPIDDNSCKLVFEMFYRTKPAFLGGLAKGKFKKNIANYQIAVEHHVKTGEAVNKDNFRRIKKLYK